MRRLAELRKEKSMSQEKLAKRIGVSRSAVAMWETGASQPDNETLVKLADMMSTTTDYLLGISDVRTRTPDMAEVPVPFTRFAKQLYDMGLSEADLEAILNIYTTHRKDNE